MTNINIMDSDFSLFTSLRFDPDLKKVPSLGLDHAGWNHENESSFYMLDLHRDRILQAAEHWRMQSAIDVLIGQVGLQSFGEIVEEAVKGRVTPARVRVVFDRRGTASCELFDTPPIKISNLLPLRLPVPGTIIREKEAKRDNPFVLVVDNAQTSRSEYTHYKTTRRAMYDAARERAKIELGQRKEVLLVDSQQGVIMEGSLTTPYFWRNDRWVTPPIPTFYSEIDGSGGQLGTTRRWALERGYAAEEAIKADSLIDGEECWISNGVSGFIPAVLQL